MNKLPIGILDSGIGGASILKEIINILPKEKFVYLADTKNLPYGNKSIYRIQNIVRENANYLINNFHIKMLIVACNTASSVASNILRDEFNIPIICIEPPIKPAIECDYKKILILATERTLKSNQTIKNNIKIIKNKNKKLNKDERVVVKKLAIKNLASEIDKNFNNLDLLKEMLIRNLSKYKDCDAVVVGCTHYNFIKDLIQDILPETNVISCEKPVANRTKYVLERDNLMSNTTNKAKNVVILTKPNFKLKNFLENYLK